ncbi:3'-5' exonuclease, partial [Propionibacterium freudenreichii]|uniref:3'-5' exonuclease n=1 Tax=Propionibacterium freudenreichii TaxID=1744 RepID=UPI0038555F2C
AYVRISEQMDVLDEYVTLVNPGRPIEPGAIGVHGITEEEVADAITIEQAIAPLQNLPCVLVAHNLPFDLRIAGPHLEVVGEVCTLALSRQYV